MTERMTLAQARRLAMIEAIEWINYRIEVCRREEARWPGASRAAATERSARMELELAQKAIASMADQPRGSRQLRQERERRASYLVTRPAPDTGDAP